MYDKDHPKRLTIYQIHDRVGFVDEYVFVALHEIARFSSKLIVIVNGILLPECRNQLETVATTLWVQDYQGDYARGFKSIIERLGQAKLGEFDEILLMTDEVFGPLHPLSEMFAKMNDLDLDFWGITMFNGSGDNPTDFQSSLELSPYLHTYFLVIRKSMFATEEFGRFWRSLPDIFETDLASNRFASDFTRFFEQRGFKWQAYWDSRINPEGGDDPLLLSPLELIKTKKCPFFSRRNFDTDYSYFLKSNNGESTLEAFEYIQDELDYDINLIWDHILRTKNLADLHHTLHLNYILSSEYSMPSKLSRGKVALLIHLFFEDLIEECYHYAQSIPNYADVYITTDTEAKKEAILKVFTQLTCNKLTVSVISNRGRDVSALLVASKEYISNYDFVCFIHSKKSSHMSPITGASWRYKCLENLLRSKPFVENIIHTFQENPRLGMLVTPHPSHGDYYSTLGVGEWLGNYKHVVELAEKLGLKVDINAEKEPIAPLGSMFWFRPTALKTLFSFGWDYEDFPEGKFASDGTISHAIERIYPFVAQSAGYYSAYLMSEHFARIEDTNLYFMLRRLNKALFKIYRLNSYMGLLGNITASYSGNPQKYESRGITRRIKSFIYKIFRAK